MSANSVSGFCNHSLSEDVRKPSQLWLKYIGIRKTANIEAVNHCFGKKIITSGFWKGLDALVSDHVFFLGWENRNR